MKNGDDKIFVLLASDLSRDVYNRLQHEVEKRRRAGDKRSDHGIRNAILNELIEKSCPDRKEGQ
jgi:hypothetical protein